MVGTSIRPSRTPKRKLFGATSSSAKRRKLSGMELATDRRIPRSSVLGNLGRSVVPVGSTTLARTVGPFSGRKYVTLVFESYPSARAPAAAVDSCFFNSNSAFAFDASGYIQNKQPLYYDQLLAATGPYKFYKVISWRTTFTFVNTSTTDPLYIFVSPTIAASADFDSIGEADNMPGVKRLILSPLGGSKSNGTVTVRGNVKDLFDLQDDSSVAGNYTAAPSNICIQGVYTSSGSGNNVTYRLGVKHEMFTELSNVDAVAS